MSAWLVDRDTGTVGKPTLQVGGAHAAVMVAAPGPPAVTVHDSKHPVPTPKTPGRDEVHTSGIFPRITPPFVFGKELLPMMSVSVAITVCEVDFEMEKLVCPDPAAPSSRERFRIGQVAKKSRAGDVVFPTVYCGCWKDVLVTPLAVAKILVIPGTTAKAVA